MLMLVNMNFPCKIYNNINAPVLSLVWSLSTCFDDVSLSHNTTLQTTEGRARPAGLPGQCGREEAAGGRGRGQAARGRQGDDGVITQDQ